jgi:(p)ppGpp synthase/HD superfamily hydrolase
MKFDKGVLLSKMLVFATNHHAGQFDKGNVPYILHPLAVMQLLSSEDEELQCVALGHDIVEDCSVTYDELRQEGFTDRIINGIRALTKIPGESYSEYQEKVQACPDAILVKIADLRHNTDITRLKGVEAKDLARAERYWKFYVLLLQKKGELNL